LLLTQLQVVETYKWQNSSRQTTKYTNKWQFTCQCNV